MGTIITLDSLNTEAELAQTQANFPALMHRFPMTETTGTTLIDTVGGVEMTVDSITGDGNKLQSTDAANSALSSGTWVSPETKDIVAISFYDKFYTYALYEIGDGNGDLASETGFGIDGAANVSIADGTTSVIDILGSGRNAPTGHAMTYASGGNLTVKSCAPETLAIIDNGSTSAAAVDFTGVTIPASSRFNNIISSSSCYGLLIFHFDTLPLDINTALQWMTNEWMNNGNKTIYPAWKNRT